MYTLTVQTAYVTSVESMLSSNYYIKSGITEIDNRSSNDLLAKLTAEFKDGVQGVDNIIKCLKSSQDEEIITKYNAVVYMTVNYYIKKDITVKDTGIKLGDATDVKNAESILVAKKCESSYTEFIEETKTLKQKYSSQSSQIDLKNINANDWSTKVKQCHEAKEEMVNKMYVYASVRDAFLFANGMSMCSNPANTDEKLLVGQLFITF